MRKSYYYQVSLAVLPFIIYNIISLCRVQTISFAFSEEVILTSLEAGYLEQCTNNLKATLIMADIPNQVSKRD